MADVNCRGYGMVMSPWRCLQNQLSFFCFDDWPCWTCPNPVTIALPPEMAQGKRKPRPKGMSLAVAKSLGLY
jgi:hypothetical protein